MEEIVIRSVVTLEDLDHNLACIARYDRLYREENEVQEKYKDERLVDTIIERSLIPFPITHNNVCVAPSRVHGKGVFALKAIPANVIVSFYPCDMLHFRDTNELMLERHIDELNMDLEKDIVLLNAYKYNLSCSKRGIGIIGNPKRYTNRRLLAHLVNDGGQDVFANVDTEKLSSRELLHQLIKKYQTSTRSASNVTFAKSANETVVCILSLCPIAAGQELFVSYGIMYWINHHYGVEYQKHYPILYQNLQTMFVTDK